MGLLHKTQDETQKETRESADEQSSMAYALSAKVGGGRSTPNMSPRTLAHPRLPLPPRVPNPSNPNTVANKRQRRLTTPALLINTDLFINKSNASKRQNYLTIACVYKQ